MVELERVTGAYQSNLMSSYTCTCSQFDFIRTIVTKEQMLTPFSLVMYYVFILGLIQYFFVASFSRHTILNGVTIQTKVICCTGILYAWDLTAMQVQDDVN